MLKLSRLLTIAFLIAVLVATVLPLSASAHTTTQRYFPVREPSVSVFSFRGRVSFFPALAECHSQINCLTIANRTGKTITLYLNGRWYVSMWAGEVISPTLPYGRDVFAVNRFAPLEVIVQRPMNRCGRFGCYPGGRYW